MSRTRQSWIQFEWQNSPSRAFATGGKINTTSQISLPVAWTDYFAFLATSMIFVMRVSIFYFTQNVFSNNSLSLKIL